MMNFKMEITGHILTAQPDILDFGVCIINTMYQLHFEVKNISKSLKKLNLKFPRELRYYLSSDLNTTLLLGPSERRVIWIKFIPRFL